MNVLGTRGPAWGSPRTPAAGTAGGEVRAAVYAGRLVYAGPSPEGDHKRESEARNA